MTQNLSDYFASEAGEYLEQMERELASDAPDAVRLARLARGVRGSAQVAGASAIAAVAERLEWALRRATQGEGGWGGSLPDRAGSTVRALRPLVQAHGNWGEEEERRARTLAESWGDASPPRRETGAAGAGLEAFVARELTGVIASLDRAREALAAAPADLAPLREVLRSTRALRGVTGARPLAPVLQVLEAVESFTAALAASGGAVEEDGAALLSAAREALMAAGRQASAGSMPDPDSPEQVRFRAESERVLGSEGGTDTRDAVPVEELFAGGGVHVVSSPVAPSSGQGAEELAGFLRDEAGARLARAEAALQGLSNGSPDDARAALLECALGVRGLAVTYGHARVAEAADRDAARLQLSPSVDDARAALDALRGALPQQQQERQEQREATRGGGDSAVAQEAPASEPRVEPGADDEPVPMEDLLLRGERALAAALALRERALASAEGEDTRQLLEEIFDLLELSRTGESVA